MRTTPHPKEKRPVQKVFVPRQKKNARFYIKIGQKYYTSCSNWSNDKKNGIYFSNQIQAENAIKLAHLQGVYISQE
jgi:hypothetical protein